MWFIQDYVLDTIPKVGRFRCLDIDFGCWMDKYVGFCYNSLQFFCWISTFHI